MPRKSQRVPSYGLQKPSGQARVIVHGEHVYLGRYGSPESHEEYARVIAELAVAPQKPPASGTHTAVIQDLLVCELIVRYLDFARSYHVRNGEVTTEYSETVLALRPLNQLYGTTEARRFGPLSLKAVRQHVVDCDLSRGVVATLPFVSPQVRAMIQVQMPVGMRPGGHQTVLAEPTTNRVHLQPQRSRGPLQW